jgi:hypothetical protein
MQQHGTQQGAPKGTTGGAISSLVGCRVLIRIVPPRDLRSCVISEAALITTRNEGQESCAAPGTHLNVWIDPSVPSRVTVDPTGAREGVNGQVCRVRL